MPVEYLYVYLRIYPGRTLQIADKVARLTTPQGAIYCVPEHRGPLWRGEGGYEVRIVCAETFALMYSPSAENGDE